MKNVLQCAPGLATHFLEQKHFFHKLALQKCASLLRISVIDVGLKK